MEYHNPMKPQPQTDEYTAFESLMRKVLQSDPAEVRSDIEAAQRTRAAQRISQGQAKRGRKPNPSAAGRVSRERD
jgi:hypothetical protein